MFKTNTNSKLEVDQYSSAEMFENLKLLMPVSYVESVLAVSALTHKEITVCYSSNSSSIIFSLEMGMV